MTRSRQTLFVDEPVPAPWLVHVLDPETELAVVVVVVAVVAVAVVAVVVAGRRVGVWVEAMRT